MKRGLVVLRILLVLTLVLNGAGSAFAMVRMHAAVTEPAVVAPAQAEPHPCHDSADTAPGAAQPGTPLPGQDNDADARCDCCPSGCNGCACMNLGVALYRVVAIAATTQHGGVPAVLRAGHLPPRLPHLIRPPIV